MGGFFGFIFGMCILIIRGLIELNKQTKNINNYNSKIKTNNIKQGKRISKQISNNNQITYYDVNNEQEVYKDKDRNGIIRWKYIKNNQWVPNSNNENNYIKMFNNTVQDATKQKWTILENFWDDTIIRDTDNCDPKSTYLDDFRVAPDVIREEKWIKIQRENGVKGQINTYQNIYKNNSLLYSTMEIGDKNVIRKYFYDNDPLNQKIYVKNFRPYQLAAIFKENKNFSNTIIYLIRFGKKELSLKETHNILDKQNSNLWTKWYAITKEEFRALTNLNKGKLWCPSNLIYKEKNEITMVKYYMKPVNLLDVAFNNNIDKNNWFLNTNIEFYGIKKAFDINGNFIGEQS